MGARDSRTGSPQQLECWHLAGGWTARDIEADGGSVAERTACGLGAVRRVTVARRRDRVGHSGAVRLPKSTSARICFYYANGNADDTRGSGPRCDVLASRACGRAASVGPMTRRLNRTVRLSLKVLGEPLQYHRTDPACSILPARLAPAMAVLRHIMMRSASGSDPEFLLVRRMALAWDWGGPGRRLELRGAPGPVAGGYSRSGVERTRPDGGAQAFLVDAPGGVTAMISTGSTSTRALGMISRRRTASTMTLDANTALTVSARIAEHLCDTAFRHADRCTWMGTTQDAADGADQIDFTYGTLGPDLYGGTSGVALFLSEVSRHTGDRRIGDTALAGIAHALDRVHAIPPSSRGRSTRQVGFAYAAALIGRSWSARTWKAQASRLTAR